MSVEKVRICGEWQLYIALFTDVTNLKELRQSVIDGELDVALISPSMVGMTNYHIGPHRTTSDNIGQHRTTSGHIGPHRTN